MAIRMTKEVKTYAEREFGKKVGEAREKFFLPIKEREQEMTAIFKSEIDAMNQKILELQEKYPDFYLEVSINYTNNSHVRTLSGSASLKKIPSFNPPDKIRFMAELSIGETLDDVENTLEKYFS